MGEDVKLLPCPFCGGEARSHLYIRDGGKVQCTNYDCQAGVTAFNPNANEKAIAAWNTRALTRPSAALREALEEARAFVVIHGPAAAFPDLLAKIDAAILSLPPGGEATSPAAQEDI